MSEERVRDMGDLRIAAQGDLLIRRVDALPSDLVEARGPELDHPDGTIVAHSETGHHHVLERPARVLRDATTGQLWAIVAERAAVLRHHRAEHQHAPIGLPPGFYELRRQREMAPDGYERQVTD